MQVAVELNDAFEAKSGTSVGRCAILKRVDVVLDGLNCDAALLSSLLQQDGVVNTLCTRGDLLASHEEVVGVGEARIMRIEHRVERSRVYRVPIQHVEVCVVLFTHDPAESLLRLRGQVLELTLLNACLLKHFDAFAEIKLKDWVSALEILKRILLVDDSELASIPLLHLGEHEN